ncbi:MAG: hypothetical protein R3F39_05175 [Myxococcota bacterium]
MDRAFFKFPLDTRVMIVGLALESLLDESDMAAEVRFLPRERKAQTLDADVDDPLAGPQTRRSSRDATSHVRSLPTLPARIPSRRDGRGRSEHLTPCNADESFDSRDSLSAA